MQTSRSSAQSQGRSVRAAALGLLLAGSAAVAAAADSDLPPADFAIVQAAALDSREQCQRLMHEDSLEFLRCVDHRLLGLPVTSRESALRRLGTTYYAWLASVAALKNGLPTADETALHFLGQLRAVQRPLGVSDDALCPVLPGDCLARNARLRQMDAASGSAD